MAAEIELKKINEYVSNLVAVTSITGAYVYGIDSNGNSIKIAVSTIAGAGTDYSQQIAELTTKCNNNTTLITALQSAVNGKANAVHTHQISAVQGLQDALDGKAASSHTHAISQVNGLQDALDGKAASSHTHQISGVQGLQDALDGKAAANHTHQISSVNGLQDALDGKAAANHTHAISQVSGLQDALSDINTTVGGLNTTVNGLNTTVNTLNGTVTTLRNNVADMQGDVAEHEDRISALEQDGGGYGEWEDRVRKVDMQHQFAETEGEIGMSLFNNNNLGLKEGHFYKNTAKFLAEGDTYYVHVAKNAIRDNDKFIECVDPVESPILGLKCKEWDVHYVQDEGAYFFVSVPTTVPSLADIEFLENNLCIPFIDEDLYDEEDYDFSRGYYLSLAEDGGSIAYEQDGDVFRILNITTQGITFTLNDTSDIENVIPLHNKGTGILYYKASIGADNQSFITKDIVGGYIVPTSAYGYAFGGTRTELEEANANMPIGMGKWIPWDVQEPTQVADGDNFLILTNDKIGSTIAITYNSTNQHLELKGNGGAVVSYVDMSEFIVDGMLDNVEYYTTAEQGVSVQVPYLKFTFNTDSGKSEIRISLHDLVDIYDGANINLTSAFVKAATYSAPAIGDSMDVAIGKLLKGHEDNATALEQKATSTQGGYADSALQNVTASGSGYVTLEAGAKTGNNGAKTQALSASLTMQALATADAQHQGLAEASDVKAALNSVASGGLKLVDLTTYTGTNGEIVLHNGVDTDEFEHGAVYERQSETIIIPASTPYFDINTDELTGMGLRRGTYYKTTGEGVPLRWFTYQFSDGTETKVNVPIVAEETVGGYIYQRVGIGESVYHDGQFVKVVSATYRESGGGLPLAVVLSDGTTLTDTSSGRGNITPWAANYIDAYIADNGDTFYCPNSYTSRVFVSELWEDGIMQVVELFTADARPNSKFHQGYAQEQTEIQVGKWERIYLDPTIAETITGAASTITTADLTASKVLGSDANGKVAATSIATMDAEDAVSKRHTQNTDTKIVSGNNKVEVSANGTAITGNGSVSGNLSISGNLNVTGKETVEEIVNIKSENNFITLRDGAQTAIGSGSLSGTKVENYDGLGNDLLFGTDADGTFRIGDDGGTLEPILTRVEVSQLAAGDLLKWDSYNQRAIAAAFSANKILVTNSDGKAVSTTTVNTTNLASLEGVTTNIQTQLNAKAPSANTVNGAPLSNAASYFYGVSTSAAADTMKTVSIPSITTLNEGQVIVIKPTTSSNSIENATLKLNDFTAYPINYATNIRVDALVWSSSCPSTFVFTGTHWLFVCRGIVTSYSTLNVEEGTTGISTANRVVRADYLQQIIHGQIDKFVSTRATTEDAYWDLVTAGTVQADTLYITFDNDWEG